METESNGSPAEYVFSIRFRLIPETDVRLDPQTFETTLFSSAAPPGEEDWLFFRNNLWRGEVSDESHMRDIAEEILSVPVESVTFRELQTTPEYLDKLKEAIREELDTQPTMFGNAATADEVLKNYLGSSIHVRSADK